ncbi:hypothetical protein MJO28_016744 [Puccinia striiformis f. sp. tritici]|uniref:Uncharacterized protein n=1 Tax=Puccinia striiformis f. sp. tritici TaxID=168172 RepID=A0ACC0DQH0_9BASI|nr:hypothetical protein MJO28_016744 [Puccinia striiformis f. sp. tritici]
MGIDEYDTTHREIVQARNPSQTINLNKFMDYFAEMYPTDEGHNIHGIARAFNLISCELGV